LKLKASSALYSTKGRGENPSLKEIQVNERKKKRKFSTKSVMVKRSLMSILQISLLITSNELQSLIGLGKQVHPLRPGGLRDYAPARPGRGDRGSDLEKN